jgi:hypothetical protein
LIDQISLVASQLKILRGSNNDLSFKATEIEFEISEIWKWMHVLLESGKLENKIALDVTGIVYASRWIIYEKCDF